ncbi:MAG TPA: hypothetical protein VLM76_09015 [Patescibacteria group bacterium]|nr:hypothetical protein [Patescibacteria group bacterium]
MAELIRHNDVRLVRIARHAVVTPTPTPRPDLRAQLAAKGGSVSDAVLDSAQVIAAAGARICGRPDPETRERLKGGLLERYVHDLVASRAPASVKREVLIELALHPHSGSPWSNPKEVVVDDEPFEAYECKWGGAIDQGDVDELGDVLLSARTEGVDARPCVAIMCSERDLRTRIATYGIQLDEVLYLSDMTDLPVLGERPPSRRLR